MNLSSACIRWTIGGLAILHLIGSSFGQSLPRTVTADEVQALNQQFSDWVVVVAGDQIITRTDLTQHLGSKKEWRDRYQEALQLPDEQAHQVITQINNEATSDLVEAFVEVRAGQDRGFDPEVVDTLVERRFKRQQEDAGGYQALYQRLQAGNSSPEQFKDSFRRTLYRYSWQGAITGQQIGTTGRKELNRYMRPGEIWGTYRSFLKSPRLKEVELTGFREAKYEVLELALGFQALGGRDAALERAAALRNDLVSGVVTFDELIAHWSKTDKHAREKSSASWSLGQATRISQSEFGGDSLIEFLTAGEVGEISQPLESQGAVHIFQLTEVDPEQPSKPFATHEVQEAIRNYLLDKQARVRLGRAHIQLIQESQLDPPELAQFMLYLAQESMDK